MAHEIAKLLLEHAGTFLERSDAIKTAMKMGMPLDEIERFLDWLDASRGPVKQDQNEARPKDAGPKNPNPPPPKG